MFRPLNPDLIRARAESLGNTLISPASVSAVVERPSPPPEEKMFQSTLRIRC